MLAGGRAGRPQHLRLGGRQGRTRAVAAAVGRGGQPASHVLTCAGHTGDGRVYLGYRLSKAAIAGGVLTVPVSLKTRVAGKFRVVGRAGRSDGTLVSRDGCAWGLGPILRGGTPQPGDHLLMLLDAAQHVACFRIGNEPACAACPPRAVLRNGGPGTLRHPCGVVRSFCARRY